MIKMIKVEDLLKFYNWNTTHISMGKCHQLKEEGYLRMFRDKAKVKMSNISFSPEYNKLIKKKWKRMVQDADIKEVWYSTPRKCKKCSLIFEDAIDMFKHIKDIHV